MKTIKREEVVKTFIENYESLNQKISIQFGNKLQELRKECNITQKQMADILIVAESTYANWEQGRREPSLLYLLAISRTLRISMDELFDFVPTGDEIYEKYNGKYLVE